MRFPNVDIISPIDAMIARARHGKMHRFTFVPAGGFNAYRVEKILCQYGIRGWGRKIEAGDNRSFLVKEAQAVWPEYVTCRAGVPLVSPLLDERNAQYPDLHPEGSTPVPWTEQGIGAVGLIDKLGDVLASFAKQI